METTTPSHNDISLREYFDRRIDDLEKSISIQFEGVKIRFEGVQKATEQALASADKASAKTEVSAEKQFEGVNEFKASQQSNERNLMPRAEMEILMKAFNDRLEAAVTRTQLIEGKSVGAKDTYGWIFGIAGIIIAIISLASRFIK